MYARQVHLLPSHRPRARRMVVTMRRSDRDRQSASKRRNQRQKQRKRERSRRKKSGNNSEWDTTLREWSDQIVAFGREKVDKIRRSDVSRGFTLNSSQSAGSFNALSKLKLGSQTVETLALVTVGALVLAATLLRNSTSKRRKSSSGTWVQDRSLGGKMVFVPSNSSSLAEGFASEQASTIPPNTQKVKVVKKSVTEPTKPSWWSFDEFPGIKNEKMRPQAQQLLNILEDAKAFYGRDLNVYDLVELKQICQTYSLQVKPKTSNSRDTIFRIGMQGCLDAVEKGSYLVGSESIFDFLNGLAVAIGVPSDRAAVISNGEVSARIRANLLQSIVFLRTKDDVEFNMILLKLDNILSKFQFERDAAEIEVINRSLLNKLTDKERSTILTSFTSPNENSADIMKQILVLQ